MAISKLPTPNIPTNMAGDEDGVITLKHIFRVLEQITIRVNQLIDEVAKLQPPSQ